MHEQTAPSALDLEIQSFAAVLNQCFREVRWDVVNDYAEDAWHASERAGARWPEVKSRVRMAWESGTATRSPHGRAS